MPFIIRTFNGAKLLGEQLVTLRKNANKTLSEMEAQTKIRKAILRAFEDGSYHKLPERIYARKFLKIYIRALKGDESYLLERFDQECGCCDYLKGTRIPIKKTSQLSFLSTPRMIKYGILIMIGIFIASYLGFELWSITMPPTILVQNPPEGFVTKEAFLQVNGLAEPGTIIKINGQPVLLDEKNKFLNELALEQGVNFITVEGSTRYSRPAKIERRVFFERENRQVSQHSPIF